MLSEPRSVVEMEVAGLVMRQEAARSCAIGLLETGVARAVISSLHDVHRDLVYLLVVGTLLRGKSLLARNVLVGRVQYLVSEIVCSKLSTGKSRT